MIAHNQRNNKRTLTGEPRPTVPPPSGLSLLFLSPDGVIKKSVGFVFHILRTVALRSGRTYAVYRSKLSQLAPAHQKAPVSYPAPGRG
jgi:hypothetical protein